MENIQMICKVNVPIALFLTLYRACMHSPWFTGIKTVNFEAPALSIQQDYELRRFHCHPITEPILFIISSPWSFTPRSSGASFPHISAKKQWTIFYTTQCNLFKRFPWHITLTSLVREGRQNFHLLEVNINNVSVWISFHNFFCGEVKWLSTILILEFF